MTTYQLPHHRDKPFGAAGPIQDPWLLDFVQSKCSDAASWLRDEDIHEKFVDQYQQWIASSELNKWIGLEAWRHGVVMQGTTEAFDKFYMANHQRRFRCFRGEYMYHQLAWRNNWPNQWSYLDDGPVLENDAVVISLPFSDTGGKHRHHDRVLTVCEKLNVPVLLDCAYFGICSGIEFDVSLRCIQSLTFSLSKTFPVAHARIGMRLTREDTDDPGFVNHKSRYVNRIACGLGQALIDRVSPDWVYQQYQTQQLEFCNTLGIESSQCVILGLGGEDWQHYNRGGPTNRLSFHRWLPQGELPK